MSKKTNLYLGKAGQMAVMSELLCRGWNVSVPEVDIGDDIFVVKDDDGDFIRVQVKTASGKSNSALTNNIHAQFAVSKRQLETPVQPFLIYAFVIWYKSAWTNYILISRDNLLGLFENSIGSISGKNIIFSFRLKGDELFGGKQNLTRFLNNFEDFPIILH